MQRSAKTNRKGIAFMRRLRRDLITSAPEPWLSRSAKRIPQQAMSREWASLKERRHLQEGQKNVRPLTDTGDEAWSPGNTEKGKVGVASVIARIGGQLP
jgi:hypothetical protein